MNDSSEASRDTSEDLNQAARRAAQGAEEHRTQGVLVGDVRERCRLGISEEAAFEDATLDGDLAGLLDVFLGEDLGRTDGRLGITPSDGGVSDEDLVCDLEALISHDPLAELVPDHAELDALRSEVVTDIRVLFDGQAGVVHQHGALRLFEVLL